MQLSKATKDYVTGFGAVLTLAVLVAFGFFTMLFAIKYFIMQLK